MKNLINHSIIFLLIIMSDKIMVMNIDMDTNSEQLNLLSYPDEITLNILDLTIKDIFEANKDNTIELFQELVSFLGKISNTNQRFLNIAKSNDLNKIILRYMIDYNINVNFCNKNGISLLHGIAGKNFITLCQILLSHPNIEINIKIKSEINNKTPLILAIEHKHNKIAKLIIQQNKTNINEQGNWEETALSTAILYHNNEIAKLLINDKRVNVNTKDFLGDNNTLLKTISRGNLEIFKILIEHPDIDINMQSSTGTTPLILACYYGLIDFVKLLVIKPIIKINAKDINGNTALIYPTIFNCEEIVLLLLEHGADPTTTNKNGSSPQTLAKKLSHSKLIKLFAKKSTTKDLEQEQGDCTIS